ncbi:hypothetical protein PGIGA_G00115980 [Pangasianodon gigas]|uniref:Uncharacterized protein n=1 Tax=Pangasianodon gigas TaxID=30993 RepID=A0ACC5XFX1_PANGG|nr:hypothetical protein [Pangasianodon gigas]
MRTSERQTDTHTHTGAWLWTLHTGTASHTRIKGWWRCGGSRRGCVSCQCCWWFGQQLRLFSLTSQRWC